MYGCKMLQGPISPTAKMHLAEAAKGAERRRSPTTKGKFTNMLIWARAVFKLNGRMQE